MKARLEAFADGVFAIAITLLVFEIKIPPSGGPLVPALLAQWAFFAAYAASFLQIGVWWMAHHIMSAYIERVTGVLLFANLLFLLTIAFMPFPTELAADRIGSGVDVNVAMGLYGAWMEVVAIVGVTLLRLLRRDGLIDEEMFMREAPPALSRHYWIGPVVYVVAAVVAFFAPLVALIFYLIAPLYYGVDLTRWRSGTRERRAVVDPDRTSSAAR